MTSSEQTTLASVLAAGAQRIDRLIATIGGGVMWLSLLLVLLQFAVVVLRYVFELGSIWLAESVIYCHAALLMLAAAWTLQQNGHVRLDVFYCDASPRSKAAIDLAGALLLLLPFVAAVVWFSLPYVTRSWSFLERSREASGLPLIYLLKTLIPLFALLLGLQGISQALRATLTLMGEGQPGRQAESG